MRIRESMDLFNFCIFNRVNGSDNYEMFMQFLLLVVQSLPIFTTQNNI